jgi:hypothetical protein
MQNEETLSNQPDRSWMDAEMQSCLFKAAAENVLDQISFIPFTIQNRVRHALECDELKPRLPAEEMPEALAYDLPARKQIAPAPTQRILCLMKGRLMETDLHGGASDGR